MMANTTQSAPEGVLVAVKEVNTPTANIGDVISYTITITNQTNETLTGLTITNIIDKSLQVEINSIGINGVVSSNQTLTALPLPDLGPQGQHEVVYNTQILRMPEGTDNLLSEQAVITFRYQGQEYTIQLNQSLTRVNMPPLEMGYVISVARTDRFIAAVGDYVHFTFEIYPNGCFGIVDNCLWLAVDTSLRMIPGTIKVNGKCIKECKGCIKLPDLTYERPCTIPITVIDFTAQVISQPGTIRPIVAARGTLQYKIEGACDLLTTALEEALIEIL